MVDNKNIEMEHVYIPKELATRIKEWNDVEKIALEMKTYLNRSKSEIEGNVVDIDFDINKFKSQLVEARTKLEEVIKAELEETTKVWDYYFHQMKSLRTLADDAIMVSNDVKKSVNDIQAACYLLPTHNLKELVDMIEKLASISDANKDVLNFVVKNYERI